MLPVILGGGPARRMDDTGQDQAADGHAPGGPDALAAAEADRAARDGAPPAPRASAEDLALVARLIAGDEAAFAGLVERYHPGLIRLARMFVADRGAAEEVVQDTWLGVLNGLKTFAGRSSLRTWIFRILVNRAKTRGVRDARMLPLSSFGEPGDEAEPAVDAARFKRGGAWAEPPRRFEAATPEGRLLQEETLAALDRALAALPAQQRVVVTMRDVEGWEADEVCHVLGLSETNQRVLLHRARSKLRRALEEHLREE